MKNYKERILEILRVIFDEYEGEIELDLCKDDIEQWDSLASAQIIMMIESEFNKHLSDEDIASLYYVRDIIKFVEGDNGGVL